MEDRDREDAYAGDAGDGPALGTSSGVTAVRQLLLGVALEVAAFAVLLLSELWSLPVTFALFAHINAVFFFTKGFDRRLLDIRLRRELCFFFALIFPLAGMVGIVFFIVVLRRFESRLNLAETAAHRPPEPPREAEAPFLEDDYFGSLASAFVRRVAAPVAHHEAWHQTEDAWPADHYREKEYWRLEKECGDRIALREAEAAEATVPGAKTALADALVEYVTLFQADPHLRDHYLDRALALYREESGAVLDERALLEKQTDIAFLSGRWRDCLSWCAKLRQADAWNVVALLRQGECHFQLRDYKKLALLAREIVGHQAVPAAVREIAQMWCQYG